MTSGDVTKRSVAVRTAVFLVIIVFVVLNSTVFFVRLDATRDRVYTISDVSRETVETITGELTITYYLSAEMKMQFPETEHILDLLDEYAALAPGRIAVRVVDPVSAGEVETAERHGVVPRQIELVGPTGRTRTVVYTGIVISYLDDSRTLPIVMLPETIEYELTAAVRELITGRERVVALIAEGGAEQFEAEHSLLLRHLSRSARVELVSPGETISRDVSAVVVVGGSTLEIGDLYHIDSYIMGGGRVLFAVGGAVAGPDGPFDLRPNETLVRELIEAYGVRIGDEVLLDVHHGEIPLRRQTGDGFTQLNEPYPPWIVVRERYTDPDNPITARFAGLTLYWASPLEIRSIDAAPIVYTSPDAWAAGPPYEIGPDARAEWLRDRDLTAGQYAVAAVVSGPIRSAFREVASESRLLVVGNSFFLTDLMQLSDGLSNLVFAENAIEWLTHDEDLLTIRSRARAAGPLDRIEEPSRRAALMNVTRVVNVFAVPMLVALIGVIRVVRRRRRSADRRAHRHANRHTDRSADREPPVESTDRP